jgi:hypothetical protein
MHKAKADIGSGRAVRLLSIEVVRKRNCRRSLRDHLSVTDAAAMQTI